MRGRDRKRDEDETRRRFAAVWPAAAQPAALAAWQELDTVPSGRTWPAPPGAATPRALGDPAASGPARVRGVGPAGVVADARPVGVGSDARPVGVVAGAGSAGVVAGVGVDGGPAGFGVDAAVAGCEADDDPDAASFDPVHLGPMALGPVSRGPVPPGRIAAGRRLLAGFDPGRRGVRALAAVAGLVAVAAGYLVWRTQPHAEPVVPVGSSAAVAPPSPSTGTIVVAVQGKVRRPGLVRLPAGSRMADAIAAAGGALPDVDLTGVNLARKLTDGELVVIGQTPPPDPAVAGSGGTPGTVDLNTATVAQLDGLPGIGPALAQRIVAYRTEHGGFRSIEELRQVPGIGDAKFDQIKDLVTV